MANNIRKKIFLFVFCLASVVQGMYSTYFVSILTTIERIYQIQSKTAGAILSATEIGQILGSLLIAYYGGKGNKPKWIAYCMTLTAIAALISTLPHFMLRTNELAQTKLPYSSNLNTEPKSNYIKSPSHSIILPTPEQLCLITNFNEQNESLNLLNFTKPSLEQDQSFQDSHHNHQTSTAPALVIFFLCLLAIGFGSTAITTLGIPFIDDIVSKEESPLYLGLTIGLKIFGPALGFLLGSFCIRLDVNLDTLLHSKIAHQGEDLVASTQHISNNKIPQYSVSQADPTNSAFGAWWLGLVIISLPLLILAIPMYFLSKSTGRSRRRNHHDNQVVDEFVDVTYQAAEDHDIGGSRDLIEPHVLTIGDLDIRSNRTRYSDIDSSSREVLQSKCNPSRFRYNNFGKNLLLKQPMIGTSEDKFSDGNTNLLSGDGLDLSGHWTTNCLVVSHFGGLESTSLSRDEAKNLRLTCSSSSSSLSLPQTQPRPPPSSSSPSSSASSITTTIAGIQSMNLASSLLRLIKNRLLVLRMLSGTLHILSIAGFYTFLPKYLIEQFRIAPSSASAISGLAGILFVGIGAFLGGTIIRLFNVNSRMMTRWIAMSALLYAMGMIIMMNLGCPQNQIISTQHHDQQIASKDNHLSNATGCLPSSDCYCSEGIYNPVCANGTTYLSPCLAGCKSYNIANDRIVYTGCGCSNDRKKLSSDELLLGAATTTTTISSSSEYNYDNVNNHVDHLNLNIATQGRCLINCDNMIWYIVIFSIFTLIHASCEVGSMMFNLRCVESNDRTLALGLITFTTSLLGTIPCSIIYGTIIDYTCIHWDTLTYVTKSAASGLSKNNGACRAYENGLFRNYLHGVTALVMLLAFVIDCIICRRASEVNFYDNNNESNDTNEESSIRLKKSTETI